MNGVNGVNGYGSAAGAPADAKGGARSATFEYGTPVGEYVGQGAQGAARPTPAVAQVTGTSHAAAPPAAPAASASSAGALAKQVLSSPAFKEALGQLHHLEDTAVRAKNYVVAARVQTASQNVESIANQLAELSKMEEAAVKDREYTVAQRCRQRETALLAELDAVLKWDFWAHDAPTPPGGGEAAENRELVAVRFSIACDTAFGETVHLIGSAEQLGSWNPKSAVPLSFVAGDTWTCECFLPTGLEFEFKYFMRREDDVDCNDPTWQEGTNYLADVPTEGAVRTVDVRCMWNDVAGESGEGSVSPNSSNNLVWTCTSLRRA